MQLLTPAFDLAAFFDHVRRAHHRVLFLDYDGTLAPFHVDRAKAVPYPEIKAILPSLLRLPHCRTVIVSGRAVTDLARLIGVQPLPEMWGSHGWEHLSADGTYSLAALDEASGIALRRAGEILDALKLPNLREDKPVSGWIAELRQRLGLTPAKRPAAEPAPGKDGATPAAPGSAQPPKPPPDKAPEDHPAPQPAEAARKTAADPDIEEVWHICSSHPVDALNRRDTSLIRDRLVERDL